MSDTVRAQIDQLSYALKQQILSSEDSVTASGKTYFVSQDGCDDHDGLSEATPWRSLAKVSCAKLLPGDCVRFRRGDVFRGFVTAQPGVTYAAYGHGEKPHLYGWDKNLASPDLWQLEDANHHIWKLTEPILDCGTLVFNEGQAHCRKLIPSYMNGRFVCRDDESRLFIPAEQMTQDLDLFCYYDARLTTIPSKGQDFPVPQIDGESFGTLYLRCDKGNPGAVFSSIEALPSRPMFRVGTADHVTIDNLCLKYIGTHAISAGGNCVTGLHVTNCVIGWVGGAIQHYLGTDPNYPQGKRGTVTRFGNGVEIYGGCKDYLVENCWIYQIYDAGITHQITTRCEHYELSNIRYRRNLIERCVYSIEYFLEKTENDTTSFMSDIEISDNILRLSGFGWGQQRHNTDTPAHIKGWSYENTASDFAIRHNLFDLSAYRMLHIVARHPQSLPVMDTNTYVQTSGGMLGQFGSNEIAEPPILFFTENISEILPAITGDKTGRIHRLTE